MNGRRSGAPRVMLLSAGLVFVSGPTGWAADARLGAPGPLVQPALQKHGAPLERAETGHPVRSHGTEGERVDLPASAARQVQVRVGHHGEFERVVFEWPEAIEHDVVHRAEQVTVAFGRPGRIGLSDIQDRLGPRVVEAWAEDGAVTRRVVLRVLPDTRVRSFSLEDERTVVIDVFGGTTAPSPVPRASDPPQDSIRELRRALEQRDAVIEGLLARVEQLERTVALSRGDLDRVIAGGAGAVPSVGTMRLPRPGSPAVAAAEPSAAPSDPARPEAPGRSAAQPREPERQETAQTEAPAPGQFEVDEEAAERALDFTLVEEGALLLPAGRIEISPSFTYTRQTDDFPTIVNVDGTPVLADQERRSNEFEFFLSLRYGLPFDSQLELGLPYNVVEQSVTNRIVGSNQSRESSSTGHGLGDFSVGLAKTVLRERNWWPDVVLRINWDTGTGERDDNEVGLGGGFQELAGSLSLVKRQDPLVFVGGASYETVFEEDDIDPGDTLGFSIGTFLAASPNTSLRLVLNQSFGDEVEVSGQRIRGSDTVQSILTLGASAILGRNVLLDGAVGVGLTDDSPDYSVSISLPIRFSTPGL